MLAAVVTDAGRVVAWSDVITGALLVVPGEVAGWFVVFPGTVTGGIVEFPVLTDDIVAFPREAVDEPILVDKGEDVTLAPCVVLSTVVFAGAILSVVGHNTI